MREITLIGNPNVGKTSIYNLLTRSSEHIGNWHGVTVESKTKVVRWGEGQVAVTDLPGLTSLTVPRAEEAVSRDVALAGGQFLYIAEAGNLACNLFLLLELIEMGARLALVVNMTDELRGKTLNTEFLSGKLGIEVIGASARRGKVDGLIEAGLRAKRGHVPPYVASLNQDDQNCATLRYNYIDQIMEGAFVSAPARSTSRASNSAQGFAADKVLLHPVLAFPAFFLMLAAVFFVTFGYPGKTLCSLLNSAIQLAFSPIIRLADGQPFVAALIGEGVVGGVGGVLAFLPQICILFLALNLMEDTGYMARIAYLTDGLLEKIGLSGKAAFTMLMGFGCTATAVMVAKNLDDSNLKTKTVMVLPFMSCGARLPVYAAITAAYFLNSFWLVFLLYITGIAAALLLASVLNGFFPSAYEPLIVLPPYRTPSAPRVAKLMWHNVKGFLVRVGTLVFSFNVLIWILSNVSPALMYVGAGGGSIMEAVAGAIAPALSPLGFGDWRATTALLAGLVAKESVVAVFQSLLGGFSSQLAAVSFLFFVLIYAPCAASVSAMRREIGIKNTLISLAFGLALAYMVSLCIYQIGSLYRISVLIAAVVTLAVLAVIALLLFLFAKLAKKRMQKPKKIVN